MNMFDLAVMIGLVVAIFSGFATGLVRSAITILALSACDADRGGGDVLRPAAR